MESIEEHDQPAEAVESERDDLEVDLGYDELVALYAWKKSIISSVSKVPLVVSE